MGVLHKLPNLVQGNQICFYYCMPIVWKILGQTAQIQIDIERFIGTLRKIAELQNMRLIKI